MGTDIFEFRIINLPDGTQIIDGTLKTPYDALTPLQMMEYTEMDIQLAIMDRMERKARREAERQQREAEHKRKLARNPLWRLACMCGLV